MNRILLSLTPTGWVCTKYGPHAAETIELFGTATLPTAFTAQAPAERVLAAITRLNPGCVVELAKAA